MCFDNVSVAQLLLLHCGTVGKQLARCLNRVMPSPRFYVSSHFSKPCIVLSCCEMLVGWLQLIFFSHPVAHSVCLLLKPGLLEAILLLFAWQQSHASRWVFFMSCFWTENTWTWRRWILHCLTGQRVQLRQRVHVHLLSVEEWGYILSIYSQNGCRDRGSHDVCPIIHNYTLCH